MEKPCLSLWYRILPAEADKVQAAIDAGPLTRDKAELAWRKALNDTQAAIGFKSPFHATPREHLTSAELAHLMAVWHMLPGRYSLYAAFNAFRQFGT